MERHTAAAAPWPGTRGRSSGYPGDFEVLFHRPHGRHLDLHLRPHRQRRDGDGGAGGIGLGDVGLVDLVDGGEVAHAGEEDGGLDDVREREARGTEDCLQVLERLAGLRGDVAGDQLAGGGIERDLAGDEDEVAAFDRRGIGADGLGLRRGDGFLGHRSLPQPARCGAILVQASIRPFTDSTDFWNMARSAALRSISTILSMPLAPITTGTPTYMPLTPYSPLRNAAHGSTRRLSLM